MLLPLYGALSPLGRAMGAPAWAPDAESGLEWWIDSSDASTITLGSGAAIANWSDKSAGGHHASQSTAGNRPTLITAGQNGKNTVRFTAASSQRFSLATPLSLSSARTIIAVVARSGPSGTGVVELLGSTIDTSAYGMEWWSNTNIYSSGTGKYVQANGQSSTAFNVVAIDLDASGGHIFLNGADISSLVGTVAITGAYNLLGYGDSAYGNFDLGEAFAYTKILSSTVRGNALAYLKTKWGTP